ncbi:hypothetical protein SAMN04488071_3395 [Kordiimonas lacus]|uniref:Uncharacterized protein n=1 Tax=Kordiimonas lacus TaxID=637679 RepID=A0A1G7EDH1_9PROT|nr:hypothetical protein SAMN04488071_3395 [Kordiimonas lacus]
MVKISAKIVSIFTAAVILSACSSSKGGWPNLSDPVPNPSEREREIVRSEIPAAVPTNKPTPPTRPALTGAASPAPVADSLPSSEEEASDLLLTIKEALRDETLAYRKAKAKIAEAEEGDALQDAWFSAQLALTRLSRTASRLDTLMALEIPRIVAEASTEAEIMERFVVGERQKLFESKP